MHITSHPPNCRIGGSVKPFHDNNTCSYEDSLADDGFEERVRSRLRSRVTLVEMFYKEPEHDGFLDDSLLIFIPPQDRPDQSSPLFKPLSSPTANMKFTAAILTLAGIAAALPAAEIDLGDGVKLVRRAPRSAAARASRKSNPRLKADDFTTEGIPTNETQVSYSSNWAGAVLIGSGYKSVTGTITVPTPKLPSGASSSKTYSASAWVGLDGDTCQTAILQTGVDFNIKGSTVSFDAWYEWYPDYAYDFSGFSISAGNQIKMTATATSTSAGSVTLTNLSTGKTVTHSFSGESDKLCETNAEWIVEDFEEGSSLVPLANFGTVTFTSASVTTTSGSTVGVSGAEIMDIKQSGTVYTDCSVSGSSTVTCTYV